MIKRKLTSQEKQDIARYLEKLDNIKVTIFTDGTNDEARFLIENGTSHLPAQRVSRKLERRGCQTETTGNPKQRVIRFPVCQV
jgi:hypothetical protein